MIDFFKTMLRMRKPVVAWVMLLMAVNMVFPLIFIKSIEGQAVLIAGMISALTQVFIFSAKGLVRIVGIGHIYWIVLIIWIIPRIDSASAGSLFSQWLYALVILNSISLVIDFIDIVRYLKGEREPIVKLE